MTENSANLNKLEVRERRRAEHFGHKVCPGMTENSANLNKSEVREGGRAEHFVCPGMTGNSTNVNKLEVRERESRGRAEKPVGECNPEKTLNRAKGYEENLTPQPLTQKKKTPDIITLDEMLTHRTTPETLPQLDEILTPQAKKKPKVRTLDENKPKIRTLDMPI